MNTIENQILANLLYNDEFVEVAYPYIKTEYFSEPHEKLTFDLIYNYIEQYQDLPTQDVLLIELEQIKGIQKEVYDNTKLQIKRLKNIPVELNWLVDNTELWCKKRSMYNAVVEAAKLLSDDKTDSYGSILHLMENAQSVSFNKDIGHSLFDNVEQRWNYFNEPKSKISFGHHILDVISEGGMSRKTLTLVVANPSCGKSLVMCNVSANVIKAGLNVLYITLELSEEKIARRIESNLLDIDFHSIKTLEKTKYYSRVKKLESLTHGKLIIKEYPNSSASCKDFMVLIKELQRKKFFTPDLIVVDYLGITANAITGKDIQSHEALVSITGQLRRLAMETNTALLSAHQLGRGADGKSDISGADIAGAYGIMRDPDLILGLINTEEHKRSNILGFKQLKNRDGNPSSYNKFIMGVDSSKMKLYDIENEGEPTKSANTNSNDDDEFGLAKANKKKRNFC